MILLGLFLFLLLFWFFDIYISKILMVAAGFESIIVGLRGFVEFIRVA